MTGEGDVGVEFRDEKGASPQGWGLRARLWHTKGARTGSGGAQGRIWATVGAQPNSYDSRGNREGEIEDKALLPQVQALYTRATYYLVSNYKTISHQE